MTVARNTEHGDRDVALSNEILRTLVGSGVHGIAIEGTDDRDEMGIYIEPPEYIVGLHSIPEHYIWRSQPEGVRSGPGDVDLVLYGLRKYLRLAIKGNPTALLPLYAPPSAVLMTTVLGSELRGLREAFLSKQAVERFLGYMHGQHERMLGRGKQNRVPNRPELVEQHGWDVKYGSHALRLAYQGLEVAGAGRLTLPLAPEQRERVLAVKRGEVPQADVSAEIGEIEQWIKQALISGLCTLPDRADLDRISAWAVAAQRRHWNWQ